MSRTFRDKGGSWFWSVCVLDILFLIATFTAVLTIIES